MKSIRLWNKKETSNTSKPISLWNKSKQPEQLGISSNTTNLSSLAEKPNYKITDFNISSKTSTPAYLTEDPIKEIMTTGGKAILDATFPIVNLTRERVKAGDSLWDAYITSYGEIELRKGETEKTIREEYDKAEAEGASRWELEVIASKSPEEQTVSWMVWMGTRGMQIRPNQIQLSPSSKVIIKNAIPRVEFAIKTSVKATPNLQVTKSLLKILKDTQKSKWINVNFERWIQSQVKREVITKIGAPLPSTAGAGMADKGFEVVGKAISDINAAGGITPAIANSLTKNAGIISTMAKAISGELTKPVTIPGTKDIEFVPKDTIIPPPKLVKAPLSTIKRVLGVKPAPFVNIKKRETTLLKERIKEIQKQAKIENWGKVKLAREIDMASIRQEKAVRKEQLKTIKTGITERFKGIQRGIRKGGVMTRDEVISVQTKAISALEESRLDANDKATFIHSIKNIQTEQHLRNRLPEILTRIKKLEQMELNRSIQVQLTKELRHIKPIKVGQKRIARYDYQTNKFLEGLRRDNKLNQDQSQLELDRLSTENLSELDKIKTRFLSLKANGAKASVVLHEQVLADIRYLKEVGKTAKDDADFIKKVEKHEKVEEILNAIREQKNIPILKKLGTAYVSSIANLYSTINTIAGKNIADKYDYGMYQTNSQYDFTRRVDKVSDATKKIYNVKSDRQLNHIIIKELSPTDWTITDITGLKTDISRFNLIDIYNSIKNDLSKARYYNAFGEEQVNALLQNLTEEDIKLADLLMDEVQQYKDVLNQRSIETTGRDLGEVENYWPSTSEYEVNFYDDIRVQGETPSAMKERAKSSKIIPRIDNAWTKFQKHIAQAEHIKTVSPKYETLKNLFSDRTIKHTIKDKFGDEVYTSLMNHVETLSLNKKTQSLDIFSGAYNTALNNWVKAKIASPTVFVRQLISSIYSLEKVGAKNFLKYQAEALSDPKKAFDYMWNNIPFLKARFKQGYSEALQDAIKGTSELKVGMGSITKYVTILTRGGDITGIIINGYPIIKTEMAKHGNMQKAIDEFQKFTEKTQQSGTIANLSRLQRERNAFARTFFRFKNTTNQLLRLQTDATIQFINKQITPQQFATKTALYSIYTPIMYVLLGYMITQGWKKLFGTDDEEKDKSLLGDILAQIIIQPFQALPLIDMAVENAYAEIRKRTTGKGYYFGGGLFSYPLLGDIETAWSKIKKKEPTTADFLRVFSLLQEPISGIPTETFLRYFGYTQKKKSSTIPTRDSGNLRSSGTTIKSSGELRSSGGSIRGSGRVRSLR